MKSLAVVTVLAGIAAAVAGCGVDASSAKTPSTTIRPTPTTAPTSTSSAPPPVVLPTTTALAPAPDSSVPTTKSAPTTVPARAAAIMPNVVCMNLQTAQNTIQAAGVFYSRSNDATGKGRKQIVDRNWVVVSQSPAPGTPFSEGTAVLSVVKYGETSQCG